MREGCFSPFPYNVVPHSEQNFLTKPAEMHVL